MQSFLLDTIWTKDIMLSNIVHFVEISINSDELEDEIEDYEDDEYD